MTKGVRPELRSSLERCGFGHPNANQDQQWQILRNRLLGHPGSVRAANRWIRQTKPIMDKIMDEISLRVYHEWRRQDRPDLAPQGAAFPGEVMYRKALRRALKDLRVARRRRERDRARAPGPGPAPAAVGAAVPGPAGPGVVGIFFTRFLKCF